MQPQVALARPLSAGSSKGGGEGTTLDSALALHNKCTFSLCLPSATEIQNAGLDGDTVTPSGASYVPHGIQGLPSHINRSRTGATGLLLLPS